MDGLVAEKNQKQTLAEPKTRKAVGVLGVPLAYGASMAGVELGPAALRVARLNRRIADLGYEVRDLGDLHVEQSQATPAPSDKLKHLPEISAACKDLAQKVATVLEDGELPLILGGDHSIAIGSITGFASHCRKRNESPGLIWFDAHADMNTPESSPSGNIHGMPLAVVLGYGAPELINIGGFSPKLDPALCVHVGARDIDRGERVPWILVMPRDQGLWCEGALPIVRRIWRWRKLRKPAACAHLRLSKSILLSI